MSFLPPVVDGSSVADAGLMKSPLGWASEGKDLEREGMGGPSAEADLLRLVDSALHSNIGYLGHK
jgi:hypothetical protein